MDDFILRSIDEFDSLFVEERKAREAQAKRADSLIPQMEAAPQTDAEPIEIDFLGLDGDIPAQPVDEAPAQEATPFTQLYESKDMSEKSPNPFLMNYDDVQEDKPQKSAGALAGKIIAIVLLAASVCVFIFGCFLSVFLDNTARSLGKYTLNTQSADVEINGADLKKGDLIIAEKIGADGYNSGDYVAVASTTSNGCDIMVVNAVEPSSEDNCRLQLVNAANLSGVTVTYDSKDTLGRVNFYIGKLAGLIGFAINNAILICLLFLFLVALLLLVVILIDKSQENKLVPEEETAAESAPEADNGDYDYLKAQEQYLAPKDDSQQ